MTDLNFKAGDYVKLRLALEELEGSVLESPGKDLDIVLLKLRSGYNVGIKKENILGSRVLKRYKEEEKVGDKKGKIGKVNKGKKKIGMIITGGTIAAKLDPKTGGVHWLTDLDEFKRFYPGMFEIADVAKIEVPFMTSSEAMGFEHWAKIAESAEKMWSGSSVEGVGITHGTGFIHYTSAALSFFLRDLGKPVVFTYSQRSIDRASSDADLNLRCAAQLALSDAAEVMVCGHANIDDDFCHALLGSKVRKLHTSRRDAFKPVNIGPLARIYPGKKVEFLREYRPRNSGKVKLEKDYTDKVALVKFYPGQDPDILDFYALKYKGIVVEASGLGHLPVSESGNSWVQKLKKHIRNGFVVCAAAQTVFGRLDPLVYSNGREIRDAGVIFLEDMLAETAFVKLGWLLGKPGMKGKIKEKMLENISGELNERLAFWR